MDKSQKEGEAAPLKLNIKRTMYIGLAFFTILMLWQVYNTYLPLMLESLFVDKFGGTGTDYGYIIGVLMAAANIFALVMIPLFGVFSDRTKGKMGRRMPYILVGTIGAVVFFPFIPVLFALNSLAGVIAIMVAVFMMMNMYRNPAVSLMPDLTPKPLRSKANAVINFMGYLGPIFIGALIMVFPFEKGGVINYSTIWVPFAITCVLMLAAVILLVVKIKENKLAAELEPEIKRGEELAEVSQKIEEDKPLSKTDKFNLKIILISVFLWFFAFNAIEKFGSLFSANILMDSAFWGLAVILLGVSALAGFLPGAWVTAKLGRKKTILIGLTMMLVSITAATIAIFAGAGTGTIKIFVIITVLFSGVGWGWVNINSYPMVVEMSSRKNIGKFTGRYYFASMLAQSITPIAVGFLFTALGSYNWLFPYVVLFTVLAMVVFMFYKVPGQAKAIAGNAAAADADAKSMPAAGGGAADIAMADAAFENVKTATAKTPAAVKPANKKPKQAEKPTGEKPKAGTANTKPKTTTKK